MKLFDRPISMYSDGACGNLNVPKKSASFSDGVNMQQLCPFIGV